jgi:hypothetical protein
MPRRKTGGRKRGTKNRKTVRRIQRLEEGALLGVSPLEVMLDNMRHAYDLAKAAEAAQQLEQGLKYRRIAQECADDAAQFVHPKLAQTEVAGPGRGAIPVKIEIEYVRATHAEK